MTLTNAPINALRRIAPYAVGVAVHSTSLFFMVHGLWRNAWHGYAFALVYGLALLAVSIMVRRVRKRIGLEFRRTLAESGGPAGV